MILRYSVHGLRVQTGWILLVFVHNRRLALSNGRLVPQPMVCIRLRDDARTNEKLLCITGNMRYRELGSCWRCVASIVKCFDCLQGQWFVRGDLILLQTPKVLACHSCPNRILLQGLRSLPVLKASSKIKLRFDSKGLKIE